MYYKLLKPHQNIGFKIVDVPNYATNNAHMFFIVFDDLEKRSSCIERLKNNNIMAVFHYLSLHKSDYYKDKYTGEELTWSDYYTDRLLRLPMYFELTESDIMKIVSIIIQ
jgi:dTDP-4-amino-4,6-dideoxygalactose transaminase